jgi:hypothetical protein
MTRTKGDNRRKVDSDLPSLHLLNRRFPNDLAEGEGFEPPEPFPVQWFSRPPPSTTRPSLRVEIAKNSARLTPGPLQNRPSVTKV